MDWNPHYLYDPYFGDKEKAEWFLTHICTYEWNAQHDNGKPISRPAIISAVSDIP